MLNVKEEMIRTTKEKVVSALTRVAHLLEFPSPAFDLIETFMEAATLAEGAKIYRVSESEYAEYWDNLELLFALEICALKADSDKRTRLRWWEIPLASQRALFPIRNRFATWEDLALASHEIGKLRNGFNKIHYDALAETVNKNSTIPMRTWEEVQERILP